jgi:vacuolar protein sorting-associated protein 13A/C
LECSFRNAAVVGAQGKVLEPVDLTAAYKNDGQKRDVAVEITKIILNVSPDVLTILSDVANTVWKPIQAASPEQPLSAVNAYKRISSSHHKKCTTPPFTSIGSGGLDFLGHEKGFTFWAPVAPPGFCILGHLITSGTSQPTQEVISIALNSGVVAWPLRYEMRWQADSATVWEAIAPAGYTALGCFVTLGEAPGIHSMICVHGDVLVQSPVGECVVRTGEGSLWSVDNAAGSFFFSKRIGAPALTACLFLMARLRCAATLTAHATLLELLCADTLPTRKCFDLRSPIGVAHTAYVPPVTYMPEDLSLESCAYVSDRGLNSFRCSHTVAACCAGHRPPLPAASTAHPALGTRPLPVASTAHP